MAPKPENRFLMPEGTEMEEFVSKYLFDPTIGSLVAATLGIIAVVVVVRILQRVLTKYIQDSSSRYRARKAATFFGYLLAFRLGGFTVAFGVAGAGIAFALQEVIASIAGWFTIAFSRFYKTGDRIELGGIKGDVLDIGILRTTLMEIGDWVNGDLYNGKVVRLANSFVFKEPVYNYSGDFPFLWDEIVIPVKYGSDLGVARELIANAGQEILGDYASKARVAWDGLVKKYAIENAQVEPLVTMLANENWVSFTLRYVVEFKQRRTTKDKLYTRILSDIANVHESVQVASTSMDVTLLDASKLPVEK